ncbi:MAG: fatty acid desaturase [Sinimarinibacterium flocculans]|uniref:fatty acid desaturase n=1 Tax=Sinimarinibacterium flocculans TaxID=985250 RepID=UPI003C3B5D50
MSTQTLDSLDAAAWTDGKRYLWLLSPLVPVLALIGLGLHQSLGWGAFTWSGVILLYGIIPLLDWLVGADRNNPPESAVAHLENDRYYRAIVYAYLPAQYAVTVLGAWVAVTGDLAVWEYAGLVLTVGAINGIGINTAHELGHKKESLDRWLAKLTLAPVAYGHFFIEHNKGHHKNVATPDDPASSKMGESFWAFLPRTMSGSLRSAWDIEKQRLARNGKRVWSADNENLQAWGMSVLLFGALTAWLGWPALLFLGLQAFYGASLLEVINYIEHYGLLRQRLPSGRYERCAPRHSWNSNHIVTNLFLYQLQRHSDHHANPTRRFQALRHFDESPQLPSGYASMLILAYIPWLWFRQMDPLVAKHYAGDLTQANLYPPKRDALIRRWQREPLDDGRPEIFPGDHAQATPAAASGEARYQCTDCGYVYDEALGCPHEGFAPGTRWSQIPDDWACPDCAVRDKVDFRRIGEPATA